jgi:hypothetical protein
MFAGSKALRLLLTIVVMLAWLGASNHCVLAAPAREHLAKGEDGMPSNCPMHRQRAPSPEKSNGCGDLPCCKTLQATTALTAKLVPKPIWLGLLLTFFRSSIAKPNAEVANLLPSLDTGPPGANNFTESVLQRSILAHAPPLFLS